MAAGDSPSVGDRIKTAREAAGLTQAELGAVLGVTQQSVQRWEQGGSLPSTSRLATIAQTLAVPVASLLGTINETYVPGPSENDDTQISASGVDLDELRRLDPEAYALIVQQAELALDRARERRTGGG